MREIKLSQGCVALVDDEDFERISDKKWTVQKDTKRSYAYRFEKTEGRRRKVYLHRVVMKASDGQTIDHIDGDGLNNQKGNMRFCRPKENSCNQKLREGGTSRFKGVSWGKNVGAWIAYIHHNFRKIHLGVFSDEERAARKYNDAAKRLFGDFAKLNPV